MARASRLILCPYCGHTQPQTDRCVECGGLFEPLSRKATQITMGPWFIRDKRVPFRPGCNFEIIARMVKAGKIKTNTVMRGPTTHQFWSVARNVPGVAHLLGYCHKCGSHVKKEHVACPTCDTMFPVINERDRLGLVYATKEQAGRAQRELNREVAEANATSPAMTEVDDEQAPDTKQREREAFLPGPELLNEVLGSPAARPSASTTVLRGPDIPPPPQRTVPPASPAPSPAPKSSHALPAEPIPEHGALDFTSFNAADAIADADEAPAGSALSQPGRQWTTRDIALVTVNVALLLIVAYVGYKLTFQPTPTPAPPNDPTPSTLRPADSPDVATPTANAPADQAPQPIAPEGEAIPEPDRAPPPPAMGTRSVADAAIARARTLEDAGNYQQAMAELRRVAHTTPMAERPRELDIAIRRVEGEIRKQESDAIFGGLDD